MIRHKLSLIRMLVFGLLVLTIASGPALAVTTFGAAQALPAGPLLASQLFKLTPNAGEASDQFGFSTAMSGDVLVISAYQDDVGANVDQGSAYVFARNQGGADNWGFVKQLLANDGAAGDHFGSGVAVSGDVIVIGAYLDAVNGKAGQGSAYVFSRNEGGMDNWGFVKQLLADDGAAGDSFGFSVGVSGDVAIVGAYGDSVSANLTQGSAYVFARNQGGTNQWGQIKHLFANDGTAGYSFGHAVAISADVAVVGTQAKIGGHDYQGSAYVFTRDQGGTNNWGFVKQLIADDGAAYDLFGQSVAVSGDVVVTGAPGKAVNTAGSQGSAYLFGRNQSGTNQWGFIKQLHTNDGEVNDHVGSSVAADGDVVVVGADSGGFANHGAAYVFTRNRGGTNNWGFVQRLMADDGEAYDYFGQSVAVNSGLDLVVAGALLDSNQAGSAYLFDNVSYTDYLTYLPLVMR